MNLIKSFCYTLITLLSLFRYDTFDVDNYIISMVVNGLYGENSYCLYINPFYNYLSKAVHCILPSVDAFTLLTQFIIFNSIWYLLYLLLKNKTHDYLIFVLVAVMIIVHPYYENYTIQTAVICFVGFISFWVSKEYGSSKISLLISSIILFLGSTIRKEGALLLLPFVLLSLIFDYALYSKTKKDKILTISFVVLFVFILSITTNNIYYKQEKYNQSTSYNIYRTSLVDYPNKQYEEIAEELALINVSKNDYELIKSLNVFDTNTITSDYLKQIDNISKKEIVINQIDFKAFFKDVVLTSRSFTLFFSFLTSLTTILFFKNKSFNSILKCTVAIIGFLIIVFYFFIKGRLLYRVICPTYFGVVFVIFTELICKSNYSKFEKEYLNITATILMVLALIMTVGKIAIPKNPLFSNSSVNDSKFSEYYGENNVYIWDVLSYDASALRYFANQSKLPSKKFIQHNLPAYEWTYGQPYWNNYLSSIGIENPALALINRSNTYYVSNNPEKVMIYLNEHYGKDIVMKNVFDIDGIPVWEFIKE